MCFYIYFLFALLLVEVYFFYLKLYEELKMFKIITKNF